MARYNEPGLRWFLLTKAAPNTSKSALISSRDSPETTTTGNRTPSDRNCRSTSPSPITGSFQSSTSNAKRFARIFSIASLPSLA